MELDVLSAKFESAYNLLTAWGVLANTFSKAMSMVIVFKLFGLFCDILYGYELLMAMSDYANKAVTEKEIFLVLFLLGVPRILHLPIICFGYGLKPIKQYKIIYDNDELNHLYTALWYGSLFLSIEYLQKIYSYTDDISIGLLYFIVLIFENGIIFYCVMLQGWVLPQEPQNIIAAIVHYLLIIWFVIASFYGLFQNWYIWYKITSKIHFDYYIGDMDEQNDMEYDEDDVEPKSRCEIFTFCVSTIFLNGFSCMMVLGACLTGIGFVILFSVWLKWSCC